MTNAPKQGSHESEIGSINGRFPRANTVSTGSARYVAARKIFHITTAASLIRADSVAK